MKVPGGSSVNKSLVALKKNLKGCLRQVNQQAGKFLAKGDYPRAESQVEVAKSIDAFRAEVESLHNRWREIMGQGGGTSKAKQTPLWEYYQPILQAVVDLGGVARIAEVEPAVGHLMNGRFAEGDLKKMARGRARWQVMIRRARKHMVKEGLLESDSGLEWRVTPQGRKAAATGTDRKE